ncbi:MAG: putative porin [Aquabacterium sp.]
MFNLPLPIFRARPATAVALACCVALPGHAHADERAQLEQLRATTLNLIKALVDGGLLSQDKADQLLRQSAQAAATPLPTPEAGSGQRAGVIRVPYVPESVRQQMRDEIKQEVLTQARTERWGNPGALPSWLNRITLEGDVRVRYQLEDWDERNVSAAEAFGFAYQNDQAFDGQLAWAPDLTNTQDRRSRMTLRARFGLTSDLLYGFKTGIRFSTGNAQAVSTSQTLGGSNGNFSKYSVMLDRAWIQWQAYTPDLTVVAGRFASPYMGSDLIWPDDINFDGAAVKFKHAFNDANAVFVNAGAFPLLEFASNTSDSWLYGAQVGAQFKPGEHSQFEVGVGYYDFRGIEGRYDERYPGVAGVDQSYLASEYKKSVRQRGNTLIRINPTETALSSNVFVSPVWGLASKFRPLTLSMAYTYRGWESLHVRGSFDMIENTGFDVADIRRRVNPAFASSIDLAKKTTAWQARLHIGSPKQELRGDWSAFLGWRRFERDAWVDAFTDTTWHMGGTNYTGWSLGGQYFIGPRTSLGLRVTSTRNLTDGRTEDVGGVQAPNLSSARQRVDVIQLELNARF